ncbi:MAG: hypothetical protein WCQ64_11015, partial [Acidobacteriota bacterium]
MADAAKRAPSTRRRFFATLSGLGLTSVPFGRALWAQAQASRVTDAMVREVTVDDSGKATGVYYVDRKTRQDVHVKGRIVILAASGCESARILLNSKSARFPNG